MTSFFLSSINYLFRSEVSMPLSGFFCCRVNVAKFLREQDHLKGHVQELAEKLQLLHKDKAYLVGQNTFLERSNEELKGKLAAAENRLISLQRDRDELVKQAEAIQCVFYCRLFLLQN